MNNVNEETALIFIRAVGWQPVRCVVKRRGKVYDMWADKRTRRKIISQKQLATMNLEELVHWLHDRTAYGKILFPDPSIY